MKEEIETIEKVELGTRVVGKRTGAMVPSTVVAIMTYEAFINLLRTGSDLTKWDSLYPDWPTKQVIVTKFDEPTQNISFFEFKSMIESMDDVEFINEMREDKNKKIYKKFIEYQYSMQPKAMSVAYPIDDVDIL